MAHHPHVRKIVGYHLSWLTIRSTQTWWKLSRKGWPILHHSPACKELFPDKPMLAYRRIRNLRDNLVRANLLKPIQTEKDRKLRRNKCVTPNCKWCQELIVTTSIKCTTTGRTYRGPENINCRVNNVVYILTCNQCEKREDRLLKGGKNTYMTSKWNDPTRSLDISTKMTITRRPHSMPKFWA